MKHTTKLAALLFAMAAAGAADASVITFETAYSTAGVQATAADYKNAVDAAFATASPAGYGSQVLSDYNITSNQSANHGSASNLAYKSTITFGVDAASAGNWSFRAGVDFGNGGALFLDNQAVSLNTHDMWWAHDYVNTNSVFQANGTLSAGNHTLTLYGLEACCDGGQQIQYKIGDGSFQNFSSSTLAPAVPEPETYGMLLCGLAVIGALARRTQRKA